MYSISWPNFIVCVLLLCEILGNMFVAVICKPGYDVMYFEINLIFLIKSFFLHDQKVVTKTKTSWEQKLLRWNKKHFSSFLEGHSPKLTEFRTIWYWLCNKKLDFRQKRIFYRAKLFVLKDKSFRELHLRYSLLIFSDTEK